MFCWKVAFIIISLLFVWTKSEYYEVNSVIRGFVTCYIELSLFNDKQDFTSPPEVPVVVTVYNKLTLPTKYENLNRNEKVNRCLEKNEAFTKKYNCLSLFLFSPPSTEEVQTTVDRFSWIFQCRKELLLDPIDLKSTNYEKQTYVTVVNYEESYVSFGNIFSNWSVEIYLKRVWNSP